jgi:hypothetical protein
MSEQSLGSGPSGYANGDAVVIEARGLDEPDASPASALHDDIEAARALARVAREQLARDIADIEHASAVLRRAQPGLQSWTGRPLPGAAKPRPLWLLIGILWLSTAVVTAGAVAAIASFAG